MLPGAGQADPRGVPGLDELDVLFLSESEVTDPVEAEIAMGLVFGLGGPQGIGLGQEEWQEWMQRRLRAMGTSQAIGLMRAVAELSEGPAREAALAAFEAAAATTAPPAWAACLAQPLTPVRCVSLDDQDGDSWALGCEFERARDRHSFALAIEPSGCREAADLAIGGAEEIAHKIGIVRQNAAKQGCLLTETELDPAEFRWRAEAAMDARDVHDASSRAIFGADGRRTDQVGQGDEPREKDLSMLPGAEDWGKDADSGPGGWPGELLDEDGPGYYALVPVFRARLRALPEPGKPQPRHGSGVPSLRDLLNLNPSLRALAAAFPAEHGRRPELPLPPKPRRQRGTAPILRLRVDLRGAKPPIWRRLEVPADITLARLHDVLLAAFGWNGGHLHVFETDHGEFGSTDSDLAYRSDRRVTLEQVTSAGRKITYTYDFGDDWRHVIVVERELPREAEVRYPRCTGGRRAGPPDDCGGIWGYVDLLEILADPSHEEHQEWLGWLGISDASQFDPAEFDLDLVNKMLAMKR